MSTLIGVRMILNMPTLTLSVTFSIWFFKVFKMFLVLIVLHYSKTYCYIFDLSCEFEETDSALLTFVLTYFSISHTKYLVNISPYLMALAYLGCQ